LLIATVTFLQGIGILWFFLLGCVVGSFLNVCIYRVPRGGTIGRPRRSFCPRCGRSLRWYDNVPLASFIALRGRCRECGEPISWRYPVVELLTGLLFCLIYFRQGVQAGTDVGQLIVMLLVTGLLIFASAVDVEFTIIPEEVTVFGMLGGLLAGLLLPQLHVGSADYQTFEGLTGLVHVDGLNAAAIGAAGGGLMVLFFALFGRVIFQKEALGFGDVTLMAMVGSFLGWKVVVVTFFLAPFFGLLYGLPLLILKDEHVMPYGPFLSLGAVLTVVFRETLCQYPTLLEHLPRTLLG
jgi:leader peptidase (prepilin peptidase)/N-methyltransferase